MDIQKIGFGDFCTIEQKRYVGPNEFYSYKVVGRKKSNVWTDVPVDANNEKETLHDHLDDVVTVVCNNLDDRTVHQFRVRDLASVKKAQAVPKGFVLVPVQCPDPDFADSLFDELSKKAIGEFGDDLLIHFSDIDEEKIWALMVEAAKAQAVPEGYVLVDAESLVLHARSIRIFNTGEQYSEDIEDHVCSIEAMLEAREPTDD